MSGLLAAREPLRGSSVLRELRAVRIAGLALALTVTPGTLAAATEIFPSRPIKIIVGPSTDVFSRIVAEHLQQAWGQPAVVEPRPGAGGKLAANAVANAAPDGHFVVCDAHLHAQHRNGDRVL